MKRIKLLNGAAAKENLTLQEGFEKFINHKMALSMSEYTIKYYADRIKQFSQHVIDTVSIEYMHEITEDEVSSYIVHRRKQNPNLSNSTINNHLRAIRCFLYYFMEKGHIS